MRSEATHVVLWTGTRMTMREYREMVDRIARWIVGAISFAVVMALFAFAFAAN